MREEGWLEPLRWTRVEMVNARTKKVLDEALELSAEDRALVAAALEASLDEDDDDAEDVATPEEIEKAWAEEIQRRVDAVLEGRSQGRPAADAIAEVRAALQASRQR